MHVSLYRRVEYGVVRAVAGLLGLLPYRVALAVAALLAEIVARCSRTKVPEARRRIRESIGRDWSEREVRRVARRALRHLFFNAVEAMRFPRFNRRWMDRHLDPGNFPEMVEAHRKPGQGGLFVVPHMGNWEMAGLAAGLRGHPLFFMVGRQRNPLTEAYLNRVRAATGLEVITRDHRAVRHVLRNLGRGKILALLPDLRSPTPGLRVRFLGGEANIGGGLGMFARHTGVPIHIGYVRRVGWTRHVWHFLSPVYADPSLDKDTDSLRLAQMAMDVFDRAIRAHPDQYYWYNKRWVLEPLEEGAGTAVSAEDDGPPPDRTAHPA